MIEEATSEFLFKCIRNHEWDKLKSTINKYETLNLNMIDSNQNNLIMYAVKYNKPDIVKLLIEKKCNYDVVDYFNRSILYEAIISDYYDIIKVLLDYSLENIGFNIVDIKDNNGQIALHYAIKNNKLEIVRLLIKHGSNVNAYNNDGYNSLHLAIRKKNLDIVKLILENNIYINAKTDKGDTALHMSLNYQTNDITHLLLKNKADVNICDDSNYYSPLHYAVAWNNYKIIDDLFEYGAEPNIQDSMGNTPIMWCIKQNEIESFNKLINNNKKEINSNITDVYGSTPLHIVFEKYDLSKNYLVEKLLEKTDISIFDNNGNTGLHYLCENDLWEKYIDILKTKKLNIFIFNGENKIPYDYVSNEKKNNFIDLIVEAYIYRLQNVKKNWNDTIDIECINKNIECKKKIKKKILNNIELFKINQLNSCVKSYPSDIKECIEVEKGEEIDFCTFTGTLLDILIGVIFLLKKHTNVCSIINTKNDIKNDKLFDFYKERGMVITDNYEFINFELVWIENKLLIIENFVKLFEKAITNSKRFIIIPLGIELKYLSHANYLIYDKKLKELERFEPHGKSLSSNYNYDNKYMDNLLEKYFKNIDENIIYIRPQDFLPKISFQILDSIEHKTVKLGDPKGFCALWAIWYVDYRLKYEDIEREKLIKILINSIKIQKLSYKNIIRNYANNIILYRDKLLKSVNLTINDFMNDNFNNNTIINLASLINREIIKYNILS
jgi:ankyrin repeat protein